MDMFRLAAQIRFLAYLDGIRLVDIIKSDFCESDLNHIPR